MRKIDLSGITPTYSDDEFVNPYMALKPYECQILKYREICDIVGEEYKNGRSLTLQTQKWGKYVDIDKVSKGKYLINNIRETLPPINTKIGQYKRNKVVDKGDYLECYATNGAMFLIDKDDEWVLDKSCSEMSGGYIRQSNGLRIHRLIMNAPDDMWVDHINGDRKDNRKANLRIVTPQQNGWNRKPHTDHKGVAYNNGKWYAFIPFDNKNDAIQFRINWEKATYGEYSYYERGDTYEKD